MTLPRRPAGRLAGLGLATVAVTVAMAGAPASAAPPGGQILSFGGDTAVADSYIVVFKDTAVSRASVGATARRLTARHGGSVARTYSAALRGFQIIGSALVARRIAADPTVAFVEQDHTVQMLDTQQNPPAWGIDRIDQRDLPLNNAYTYPTTAANVHAYVIDTGIRFSHTTFGGRAVSGFDSVDGGPADDCHGHGTHVAGTVGGSQYGVAKGVQIVAVRVIGCDGRGTNAQMASGVDWVTANAIKPAVANMSIGSKANTVVDTAVNNSINSGVTYAVAAGNGNAILQRQDACTLSPARVPAAITVGATGIGDAAAFFSNFGTCVDILAPGMVIRSAWRTDDTASRESTGTSMASPHVAGAAALVLAASPTLTPAQVTSRLIADSTPNKVTNPGPSTPNRLLFINNGDAPTPRPK